MRACSRCISKKRKCDHRQPTCSLCEKAREVCTYPSETYRRGPIAGYVKVVESRLEDLERALRFVLAQEGVRRVLSDPQYPSQSIIPPHMVLSDVSRENRPAWFDEHTLNTVGDLLRYPISSDTAESDFDDAHAGQSILDIHASGLTEATFDAGSGECLGGTVAVNNGHLAWYLDQETDCVPTGAESRDTTQSCMDAHSNVDHSAPRASQTHTTTYVPPVCPAMQSDREPITQQITQTIDVYPFSLPAPHTAANLLVEPLPSTSAARKDPIDDLFW